ncbi:MAG TPA: AMP-binding protein, partial [Streptosporangiaceae bacterium]|nr:AMP-binding protein [Streptosporangiaceae bacterium]
AGLGVARGDLVPLLAGTSAPSVHAWLGVHLAGAADVPLNPAYRGASLAHGIGLGRARLMIADPWFLPRIAEVAADLPALETVVLLGGDAPPDLPIPAGLRVIPLAGATAGPVPDEAVPAGAELTRRDTASVLFTSGTTGPAKGVIMTHAQTYAIAREIVDGLRITDQDVFYCFHPMFHMTRFGSVYTALLAGCPVVLDRRFDPAAFLDRARRYGATATIGHGPMLEAIYRQPERPDDADNPLRTILTAPLPAKIAEDFERRFGVRAIDTWGMTEVTCVTMRPYDEPLRPGSCGRPRDDLLEVAVVDPETDEVLPAGQVGEITVRPREPWVVMQGYLGRPDLTLAAWRNFRFHSGDFGYLTPGGYLYFAERSGDRIRRRAENVSAYDIESAASVHPRVQDCAAVGVASSFESDDDIKLCVVLVPGSAPGEVSLDEAGLIRHLARALPHYMVPRYIEVLPGLPRTPTGKIQRQALRASGAGPGVWDRVAAGVSVRALSSQPAASEEEQ